MKEIETPWTKPFPLDDPMGNEKNKSCWDCIHVQVAGMPNRRCNIHRKRHIWSMNAEGEIQENGETVADGCNDYEFDTERVPEIE